MTTASDTPATFRFLGQDLRPLPFFEVFSRAIAFSVVILLMMLAGIHFSPASIAVGFVVTCALGAGVSLASWRGWVTLAIIFMVGGPFMGFVASVLGLPNAG